MIGLAFPNEGITGECKHFGVVLMTQKCSICSGEEIQFTGMQKWSDERSSEKQFRAATSQSKNI